MHLTPRSNRIWTIGCGIVVLFYLLTVPRDWQCEGLDEIEYLGVAHSMTLGMGYSLYGEPYSLYPPVQSTLLSGIMRIHPLAWRSLYSLNALLGIGAILLAGSWVRRRFPAGEWAAWLMLTGYYTWSFSTRFLMAEPAFLLITAAAWIVSWRILAADRASLPALAGLGVLCLLAMATRTAAVAWVAALAVSGLVHAAIHRSRTGLLVAGVALLFGGGFFLGWEIRGARIHPDAPESYFRWAQAILGISRETTGLLAAAADPALQADRPALLERVGACVLKSGQMLASIVRPPANLAPLAGLLFLVLLTGVVRHLKETPWSPLAWYLLVSLVMICLTAWVTSYLRYLYVLSPLLFLFFCEGARWWLRAFAAGRGMAGAMALVLVGAAGLGLTLLRGIGGSGLYGAEQAYAVGLSLAGAIGYGILAATGAWLGFRSTPVSLPTRPAVWLAGVVAFASMQSAGLALLRYRMIRQDRMPAERNLLPALRAGAWIAENSSPDATLVSSFPRLTSFLANRLTTASSWTGVDGQTYVMLIGTLRDVPAFDPAAEAALQRNVARGLAEGRLSTVFTYGDGGVYKVETKLPSSPSSR